MKRFGPRNQSKLTATKSATQLFCSYCIMLHKYTKKHVDDYTEMKLTLLYIALTWHLVLVFFLSQCVPLVYMHETPSAFPFSFFFLYVDVNTVKVKYYFNCLVYVANIRLLKAYTECILKHSQSRALVLSYFWIFHEMVSKINLQ